MAEWEEALRALVQVLHENGGQMPPEEISSLLGVLLRPVVTQQDFSDIEGERMPKTWVGRSQNAQGEGKTTSGQEEREYQRLVFTAIGNLFTRAGILVSIEIWAAVIKVLRITLESMVSSKLVEDAAASRSYAAVLRCVHLVLSDSKSPLGQHVSGFVGALRVFFTYGLPNFGSSQIFNKASQGQGAAKTSGSWRDAKVKSQENGAYRPPHLRGKLPARSGKPGKFDSLDSDLEAQAGRGGASSDSELSDSDGQHEEGDRFRSSKVRTNAILSIQALARPDPKVLHAHWVVLLPTNDVLQPRPFQATLVTILLFDPIMKVRMAAASTVAVMFEGPARAFLQAAEYKEMPRSKSFTTLSSSLGQLVIQLLIGLVHVIANESHGGILVATLKALSLLVSASPFCRLPSELLPYVLQSVHQRTRDWFSSSGDQSNLMCAAIYSLGAALGCTPPSATVAANLVMEAPPVSATWAPSVNGPSCSHLLLGDLISYTQPPASPAVRVEASQALKAAVHTYPTILSNHWESISCSVMGTIHQAIGHDSVAEPFSSLSSQLIGRKVVVHIARLADDKVVHSAIKLLDEFLRATCGYQGTDESFDEGFLQAPSPFLVPKPTKLLVATGSSPGKYVFETFQSEQIDSRTAVSFWMEALNKHLPPTLTHPAPMVRGAALTCFAGLTNTLFSSLPSEKQDHILSVLIYSAWNDDAPSVRSSACRAIGVVMGFPQIAGRKEKLDLAVDVVASSITDTSVSVRITASWALANICDALRNISETNNVVYLHNLSETFSLAPLAECALKAAKDCDKVRANAVRALGNLARFASFGTSSDLQARNLPDDTTIQYQPKCGQPLESVDRGAAGASRWLGVMVQTLVSCVTTGNVKVQWNVCHALGNLFLNKTVSLSQMTWVPSVFSILLLLLRDSANYKIRIHSAAALVVPATREDYGESYSDVVKALVHALDCMDSEHESAPTSFKYNKALTDQLTSTIIHVLGLSTPEDFSCLKDFLLKRATFLQDLLTSLCTSAGKVGTSDAFIDDRGVLDQMAEMSMADVADSKGFSYDEKPLPPPKEHRRYGLQMNDSMLTSSGGHFQKVVYLRKAIRALAEMYRYGGQCLMPPKEKLAQAKYPSVQLLSTGW
ncbi:unnamed protein product [Calypogeia fissa]